MQLNYGLTVLFGVPEGLAVQIGLILLSVIIATISVTSGVNKHIKVLSELNAHLAMGLILFILLAGNTEFLLNALVLNIGDYINRFTGMTLNSFAFDRPDEWMNSWTLFFSGPGGLHGHLLSAYLAPDFTWSHHSPVCGGHTDYSVYLHPDLAVDFWQ